MSDTPETPAESLAAGLAARGSFLAVVLLPGLVLGVE
jgi:hypothetical protein